MGCFSGYFLVLTTQKYVGKTPCVNCFGEQGKCIAEWRKLPVKRGRTYSIAIINKELSVDLEYFSC